MTKTTTMTVTEKQDTCPHLKYFLSAMVLYENEIIPEIDKHSLKEYIFIQLCRLYCHMDGQSHYIEVAQRSVSSRTTRYNVFRI
jgi:hypothetical protein